MSGSGGCTWGRRRGRWGTGGSRRWRGRRGVGDDGGGGGVGDRGRGAGRRCRRGGRGGRERGGRKAEDKQPGLRQALRELAEAATRGDPVAEVTWCSLSLRELERQMAALGFRCGKDAIARMLREDGYSLQAMSKVLEGRQHPDRDAQFRHINAMIAEFRAAGDPVVSVDAKKKEQLGPYHRAGRSVAARGGPGAGPRP